jgi:hypothetical protein
MRLNRITLPPSLHVTLSWLLLTGSLTSTQAGSFDQTLKPFLQTYCTDCHGPDKQKGERRFDTLPQNIADNNTLADYQDILDQLNLSEMPPRKSDQPQADERRNVIAWLTERIGKYHTSRRGSGSQTVLRRLNAREYRNTIRDLLHLDTTIFDPTRTFPKDQTTHHLDNIGDTLVTSGYLLVRYLEAAELAIDKTLIARKKPPVRQWSFHEKLSQQPEIDQVHRRTTQFKHLVLYDVVGSDKHEGAYAPIHAFAQGVPIDGFYEIRFKAQAVNRINPYDPESLGLDPGEPLRLGIVPGDHTAGQLHKPQPVEPLLTELDLADEPKSYSVRLWLDKGYTPRFTFRNGLLDVRSLYSKLLRKYPKLFPKNQKRGIVANRYNAIKYGKIPQIHVDDIEISGPHYDSWPTAGQRALLGEDAEAILKSRSFAAPAMRRQLAVFLSRAYRRPATEEDIERIMEVIETRKSPTRSTLAAYADGLKAALCSPHFLYLEESPKRLSATALASRLSYFLWSTMPDEPLRKLAAANELHNPSVLKAQVKRLLNDKRSAAFVDGFLGSWLNLRDLGSTPPDRGRFRSFYQYDLDAAMRRETHLFARHLIDENLGITNFLDSNFTFVNKPLARHYRLNPPNEAGFQKVVLSNGRRGGLLGQASVLTVTANGIDTSPVVRGIWVLENILGTPPSPPPPDVEPLDPDIRGATTIRDQLKKHRETPTCHDCHRKIDPLGFALENFNPIGQWRDTYGRNNKVDASGELPTGERFKDIAGFKGILLEHEDQFAKAITEKLLTYAIGRELTVTDRPHIDQILKASKESGYPFRDLIGQVATSKPFRSE